MSTGTHLARTRTRTRARRVTHRTAFAANNYVRDFSVAIVRPPSPSLSLPLSSSSFLSFATASSRVSLRSQRTGLASFERRGDSLTRSHARHRAREFVPRARARYATYAQRTGSEQERIQAALRDAVVTRRSRGCVDITRASPALSAYLNISSLVTYPSSFSLFRYRS